MKTSIVFLVLMNILNYCNVHVRGYVAEDGYTSPFPVVCVANGCIEGIAQTGYLIESFEAFLGVPYAEPPIGNLRFSVSKIDVFHLFDFEEIILQVYFSITMILNIVLCLFHFHLKL